jgi:hypothetical protein
MLTSVMLKRCELHFKQGQSSLVSHLTCCLHTCAHGLKLYMHTCICREVYVSTSVLYYRMRNYMFTFICILWLLIQRTYSFRLACYGGLRSQAALLTLLSALLTTALLQQFPHLQPLCVCSAVALQMCHSVHPLRRAESSRRERRGASAVL